METVLDKAAESADEYDAVIVSGDFIKHDFSIGNYSEISLSHKNLTITSMFSNITKLISDKIPNKRIIPTFGNNDAYTDYLPPTFYEVSDRAPNGSKLNDSKPIAID